jgi:heme exporter protein B
MIRAAMAQISYDSLLLWRQPWACLLLLAFLAMTAVMAGFAIGPHPALLQAIAPAILWIGIFLASLLAAETLFRQDAEDGSLDLLCLAPTPLAIVFLLRCLAHWLGTGLPLAITAPIIGSMLGLKAAVLGAMVPGLLLGTPIMSLLTGLAAALNLGSQRGTGLLALLVLPLALPVMIFAAGQIQLFQTGIDDRGPLMMLGGLLVLAITLAPLGGAAALRLATRY